MDLNIDTCVREIPQPLKSPESLTVTLLHNSQPFAMKNHPLLLLHSFRRSYFSCMLDLTNLLS